MREMTSCNSHKKPDVTSVCDNITMAVINTMRVRTYTYLDIFKTKRLITSITILSFARYVFQLRIDLFASLIDLKFVSL